jgi:hypothetical protein
MNIYSILPIVILIIKCGSTPVTPVHDDPNIPEDCAAACENMERLGCDEAKGSPGVDEKFGTEDDVSCSDVCNNVMSGIYGIPMNLVCVSKVDSCEDVVNCYK